MPAVDRAVDSFGVFCCHPPEWILYDARRIHSHPKLKEQDMHTIMAVLKILITMCSIIPSIILDESVIDPEISRHGFPAYRTIWDKLRRNPHSFLFIKHLPDDFLVVISLPMAGLRALKKSIIPLGVEQPFLIESCLLHLMIDVSGDDEIILITDEC